MAVQIENAGISTRPQRSTCTSLRCCVASPAITYDAVLCIEVAEAVAMASTRRAFRYCTIIVATLQGVRASQYSQAYSFLLGSTSRTLYSRRVPGW